MQDHFPNTRLPTGLQVLGYYFYTLAEDELCNKGVVMQDVVADVMNHWISCNVYTTTRKTVRSRLEILVNTYHQLKRTTHKILYPASFHEYTEADILRKVIFAMHDSTSHNLQVMEAVCKQFEFEETPRALLCNIHPIMMLQEKIKELCQEIHDSLGKKKINKCFLVDVEFKNESFVLKSLKCLNNFINKDYSAKPWNRYTHFTNFIRPKRNFSLSLKDHRFNRLNECATSILYHMDDIASYLEQFSNIINGITLIDRSFLEMEVLNLHCHLNCWYPHTRTVSSVDIGQEHKVHKITCFFPTTV